MSKLILKNVRLAFPDLFVAKAVNAGDTPRFGAQLIVEKGSANEAAIDAAITEVANAKWGAKADDNLKILKAKAKICFLDGDLKSEYQGFAGNMSLSAGNTVRPTVVGRDRAPLTEADGIVYSGCYVNAIVEIWAQENTHGKRINCSLRGIQFSHDGEAFSGGGVASADEFEELTDNNDADDFM